MNISLPKCIALCVSFIGIASCSSTDSSPAEVQPTASVRSYLVDQIDELNAAAQAIASAAPAPASSGWTCTSEPQACATMRSAWRRFRTAYESIEGAISPLFSNIDAAIDARYNELIASCTDTNLFDDTCVVGAHAIERILWADAAPEAVVTKESELAGYVAAAFPSNEQEAFDFKNKLVKKLVTDVASLKTQFAELSSLDTPTAWKGVTGGFHEQEEKLENAERGFEESRYSQQTLTDMRANLEGMQNHYAKFSATIRAAANGASIDDAVNAGIARFKTLYEKIAATHGDMLPPVPSTWEEENISDTDKATDFGQIYVLMAAELNADDTNSLTYALNQASDALGVARISE